MFFILYWVWFLNLFHFVVKANLENMPRNKKKIHNFSYLNCKNKSLSFIIFFLHIRSWKLDRYARTMYEYVGFVIPYSINTSILVKWRKQTWTLLRENNKIKPFFQCFIKTKHKFCKRFFSSLLKNIYFDFFFFAGKGLATSFYLPSLSL